MDSARRNHPAGARRDRLTGHRRVGLIVAAAACLAAGCSGISDNDDGIASLEVQLPPNTFVELGTSVQLRAVARNAAGDEVEAPLRWSSPDTTFELTESGLLTPTVDTGRVRIQVGVFGQDTILTSLDHLQLTFTAKADSMVLRDGDDSLEIAEDATGTASIQVTLLGGDPAVGVANRPVIFRIIEPAPSDEPTVVFQSTRIVDSLMTDATGAVTATVRAATGRTPPDRAVVEIVAHRATGERIPRSGLQAVIRFLHQ